jgi:flavin reductase
VDVNLFKSGMRRLMTGVSLITTIHEGRPFGLIAATVTSLSADPPSLLVCVNRSASSYEALCGAKALTVNVLSDRQADVVEIYSSSTRRHERFADNRWERGRFDIPRFRDATVNFECDVSELLPRFTHSIIIATVHGVHVHSDDQIGPLGYFNGRVMNSWRPISG